MKLLKTIYRSIEKFFLKGTIAYRKKEWEWMEEERKTKVLEQNDFGGPNGHLGV